MTVQDKPRVVHQLGAKMGPFPDQKANACATCGGKRWIEHGSKSCPDCNTPAVCACVTPRPNKSGFCLGCGQALRKDDT